MQTKSMQRAALVFVVASLVTGCEKPLSTGPFHTDVVVEQWFSVHGQATTWDTGVFPVHRDGRAPSWRQLDSSCEVYSGDWGDQAERPPSFGTVKVQGARGGERSMANESGGHYYKSPGSEVAWDTGDELTVVASGGDEAPAFSIEGTFPSAPTATMPNLRGLQPFALQVPRDQPLSVTWNANGAPAIVTVGLDQFKLSPNRTNLFLHCMFSGGAGAGTVPTSALSLFEPSSDRLMSNLYIGGATVQQKTVGDHDLSLRLWKADGVRVTIP